MTVSNYYSQNTNDKKKISRFRAVRSLLLCAVLLVASPVFAQYTPPTFVNGVSQLIDACDNVTGASAGTSLNSALAVNDTYTPVVLTWEVFSSPVNGTLTGFPVSNPSVGGIVTPAGLVYIPTTGYIGTDSFTIAVTDGTSTIYTAVTVNVHSLPTLSSSLTPAPICSGTAFYYSPTSSTGGATFAWTRAHTTSITPSSAASGVGNVLETLGNTASYPVPVSFVFTVSANGCTGNPESVVVDVKPTPGLSSAPSKNICSGTSVNYIPSSPTAGTAFTWSRADVTGITPDTSEGAGTITESLVNATTAPLTAIYLMVLTANGCTAADYIDVTVDPQPPSTLASVSTSPSSSLCAGTLYQNFGASVAPPAGTTYSWSAVNADIYRIGSNNQYILVNFPNAGSASVTLSYFQGGNECAVTQEVIETVGAGPSPSGNVLYDNGQFVFTDNTMDSYQWGYDNASTLDSTLISGAAFQSYVDAAPDYADNYYWVMTTKDGCLQKTYFNAPTTVTNITGSGAGIKLYPNPATNILNIDLGNIHGSTATIVVTDMMGQNIMRQTVTTNSTQIDITNLPAGCYIINGTENGLRLGVARLIKN